MEINTISDIYDNWFEQLHNSFDDDFYYQYFELLNGRACALWFDELFHQGLSPQEAAKHIKENLKTKL